MTFLQVLDRYTQHVKNCVHCKNALKLTDTVIMVTRLVGTLAAFAAVSQAVVASCVSHMQLSGGADGASISAVASWWQAVRETGMSVPVAVSMVLVVAAILAHNWLNNVRRKFFFEVSEKSLFVTQILAKVALMPSSTTVHVLLKDQDVNEECVYKDLPRHGLAVLVRLMLFLINSMLHVTQHVTIWQTACLFFQLYLQEYVHALRD